MKLKNIITPLFIIFLVLLLIFYNNSQKKIYISPKEVSSIVIINGGDLRITLTPGGNQKEFEAFIQSFNEGKSYDNAFMSPDSKAIIKLKNGKKISVTQKEK